MDVNYPSPPPSPRLEATKRTLSHNKGQIDFTAPNAHVVRHQLHPNYLITADGEAISYDHRAPGWLRLFKTDDRGMHVQADGDDGEILLRNALLADNYSQGKPGDYPFTHEILNGGDEYDARNIPANFEEGPLLNDRTKDSEPIKQYNTIRGNFVKVGFNIRAMSRNLDFLGAQIDEYVAARENDPGGFFSARHLQNLETRIMETHGNLMDNKISYLNALRELRQSMLTFYSGDPRKTARIENASMGGLLSLMYNDVRNDLRAKLRPPPPPPRRRSRRLLQKKYGKFIKFG